MLLKILTMLLEVVLIPPLSEPNSLKNKDPTEPEKHLNKKPEEIVFNISSKKLNLLHKFLLGYGIYIAISCLHKLAAFF